jgi:hypothetical protein
MKETKREAGGQLAQKVDWKALEERFIEAYRGSFTKKELPGFLDDVADHLGKSFYYYRQKDPEKAFSEKLIEFSRHIKTKGSGPHISTERAKLHIILELAEIGDQDEGRMDRTIELAKLLNRPSLLMNRYYTDFPDVLSRLSERIDIVRGMYGVDLGDVYEVALRELKTAFETGGETKVISLTRKIDASLEKVTKLGDEKSRIEAVRQIGVDIAAFNAKLS